MSIRYFLLLLLATTCSICCHPINEIEGKVIDVDLMDQHKVHQSDLFHQVDYVKLENKEGAYLNPSCLKSYIIAKGKLMVLDRANHCVLFFGLDGNYLDCLKKRGRGPGEYLSIVDIDYNVGKDCLDILEDTGRILSYQLDNGFSFLSEMNFSDKIQAAHSFKSTNDGWFIYSGYNEQPVYHLDRTTGDIIIIDGIPYYSSSRRLGYNTMGSPFYAIDDKVYYVDGCTGAVYYLANQKAIPCFSWNLGRYSFRPELLDETQQTSYDTIQRLSMMMAGPFAYVRESREMIFANVLFTGKWLNIIHNKRSMTTWVFSNFSDGQMFTPGTVYEESLFLLIDPRIASYYINDSRVNDINEDSNYVLAKYVL